MLRKELGSVLSDSVVTVASHGSLDAGYVCPRRYGGPCLHMPARHLHLHFCSSCVLRQLDFLLPGDFWGLSPFSSSFSALGAHIAAVSFLSISTARSPGVLQLCVFALALQHPSQDRQLFTEGCQDLLLLPQNLPVCIFFLAEQ